MPIHYEIDHEQRLIRFRIEGEWDTDDMLTTMRGALADVGSRPGYDILSDHREIGRPATPDEIRKLVALMQAVPAMQGRRAAVVVSQPASYGMIRMLGAQSEALGVEVCAFERMDHALDFLRPGSS